MSYNKVLLLLLCLLIGFTFSKTIKKTVSPSDFATPSRFLFLTKFHIGVGSGQIDISYNKGNTIASQSLYQDLQIGVVNETSYAEFLRTDNCTKKTWLLMRRDKIPLKQQRQGMKHFKLFDLKQEQLWYIFMFSCKSQINELQNNNEQIKFTFSIKNNNSHFGQNEKEIAGYVFILVVWIWLVIRNANAMSQLLTLYKSDWLRISVYLGLLLLGAAYLYKLIHLGLYCLDGLGIPGFLIAYLILKNIGEAISTTMIISLAWGWSLTHIRPNQFSILIGVVAGIVNIVSLVLAALTDQHQSVHHHYETVPGLILLGLRTIMLLVFLVGIVHSMGQAGGKTKLLIVRLGWIGGVYLACWPVLVVAVEWMLPNYMHHQVITLGQQLVHISACTLLCHMISNPESVYRKVSLHDIDNPLGIQGYKLK